MILYNKNYNNKIQQWSIEQIDDKCIITFGELNGVTQTRVVPFKEYQSRINKKLHEGYREVKDLNFTNVRWDLNDLSIIPMKCQKFRENKLSYPVIGQPKLNGIRCVMRVEEYIEGIGMFETKIKKVVLRSKEGLEYVMPHITESISCEQLGDNILDGELYIHGQKLNYIKASIPMKNKFGTVSNSTNTPLAVSFNVFDLAIPEIEQKDRLHMLLDYSFNLGTIKSISSKLINSDKEAFEYRNLCIEQGYEGCVLRSLHEEYAFGSRPAFIMKFKKFLDSEFEIIDIVPSSENTNYGCKFICRNDLNSEIFESMPSGWNMNEQAKLIEDKENIIGKKVTIKYYERSGVNNVPFHSNVTSIRDYE